MTGTREEGRQRVGEAPGMNGPAEAPEGASPAFLEALAGLDEDTADAIRERAGILQFDGEMSQEDAERGALAAYAPDSLDPLEILAGFLERFPLVGMAEDGKPIAEWSNPGNFIRSREELAACMKGEGDARGAGRGQKIRRFGFIPGDAGFLALDLDRNHADGADGVASLLALYAGRPIPRHFADIDRGTFPAFTRTPSGGFHLFFKYTGAKKYGPQDAAPGVEIVHFKKLLTAPGSERGTRRYTFAGSLDEAPAFPGFLEWPLNPTAEYRERPAPKPVFTSWATKDKGKPDLDRIAQWALDDGEHGGSRNRLCFEVARRAKRHEYGRDEVKAFLRGFGPVDGLPEREIHTAVESAYKGSA